MTVLCNCKIEKKKSTLYQCVGDYAHLAIGTVFSFEGGVELIHRHHERARVLLLDLHVSGLCSEIDTLSVGDNIHANAYSSCKHLTLKP